MNDMIAVTRAMEFIAAGTGGKYNIDDVAEFTWLDVGSQPEGKATFPDGL
ncbi:hypothetical protein [Hoeflea sp. IMCC20628]|nr:hypothetical protein [Hoeflea sp. IMCC20628]